MRSLITLEKISFLFRAAMLLFMTLFISFSAQALDGGTETNPYQISSASDLSSGLGAGFYLVCDDVTCSSRITVTGEVTLTLAEGKTLTAEAGIEVGSGATLNIYGPGSLVATGGANAAGIGGSNYISCGTVNINSGMVTANGGEYGAGIGGGSRGSGGIVNILGGIVNATGKAGGAGIGGGYYSAGATVTISGGDVTAIGSENSAGIGGGDRGDASPIEIKGGKVTAIGGAQAAGIGGGYYAAGATVAISGATVIATGGEGAVGIGGGNQGLGSPVNSTLFVSDLKVYGRNSSGSMEEVVLENDDYHRYQYMVVASDLDLVKVTLSDCTIYTDEYWSTICLPFSVNIAGSILEGATAMKLLPNAVFTPSTGVLTLNFESVSTLIAGVPYIIKWTNGSGNLENPQFTGVISTCNTPSSVTTPDVVSFKGTFEQIEYASENRSILFLGGNNLLYYPDGTSTTTIGKYHAYFELLGGITAGTPSSTTGNGIKSYVMNFEDSTTGICDIVTETRPQTNWYTLDGRLLREAPDSPGLYIHKGRKIMIK